MNIMDTDRIWQLLFFNLNFRDWTYRVIERTKNLFVVTMTFTISLQRYYLLVSYPIILNDSSVPKIYRLKKNCNTQRGMYELIFFLVKRGWYSKESMIEIWRKNRDGFFMWRFFCWILKSIFANFSNFTTDQLSEEIQIRCPVIAKIPTARIRGIYR